MTQTEFDSAMNEARQDLESRGLEIVADHKGKLSTGKTCTEDIRHWIPDKEKGQTRKRVRSRK